MKDPCADCRAENERLRKEIRDFKRWWNLLPPFNDTDDLIGMVDRRVLALSDPDDEREESPATTMMRPLTDPKNWPGGDPEDER
jgi:hypothetical protein